ncbi:MAG TPA: DUF1801 domain-containing protein [Burkholderiales bacterium]|nr:DUF1801 domain-containing protein [Burkholderiales bacterium]
MKKMIPAANPDEYVAGLSGWRRDCVDNLRANVRAVNGLEEAVKWGHLVYSSNGPALLIRAEDQRVLFGFWRGKRLQKVEPRLKASGKYEMATLELREGMSATPAIVRKLTKEAIALNKALGDPRDAAKPKRATKARPAKRARR